MKRLLFILGLAACCDQGPQLKPYDLPSLARIWRDVEACSGLHGQQARFYTTSRTQLDVADQHYWGYWVKMGNMIVLTDGKAGEVWLLRHEIMHSLLQSGEHPEKYFNGVCGDLREPAP